MVAQSPFFDIASLLPAFPRLPRPDYPELDGYSWEACHEDFYGGGGLFLQLFQGFPDHPLLAGKPGHGGRLFLAHPLRLLGSLIDSLLHA